MDSLLLVGPLGKQRVVLGKQFNAIQDKLANAKASENFEKVKKYRHELSVTQKKIDETEQQIRRQNLGENNMV